MPLSMIFLLHYRAASDTFMCRLYNFTLLQSPDLHLASLFLLATMLVSFYCKERLPIADGQVLYLAISDVQGVWKWGLFSHVVVDDGVDEVKSLHARTQENLNSSMIVDNQFSMSGKNSPKRATWYRIVVDLLYSSDDLLYISITRLSHSRLPSCIINLCDTIQPNFPS